MEGKLYGQHEIERSSGLTITEITQAARDPLSGADDVKVKDRGQTTDESDHFGRRSTVLVRDFDSVTITIGKEIIEIMRSVPDDPWTWQAIGPSKPGSMTTVVLDHGVIGGIGDVVRVCHAAHVRQGKPLPTGTPHPSRLRAFAPLEGR